MDLLAIDVHSHINHGSPYEKYTMRPEESTSFPAHIEKMARAAKIEATFISTFASVTVPESILEENEYLSRLVEKTESFYQWVVVDPRLEETFEEADKLLKNKKCVGIKLHPGLHGYDLYDSRIYSAVGSFASEHCATLLIHGGGDENLVRLALEYPRLNVILPHVATVGDVDCARRGNRHGNMWLDTSGIGSVRNNIIEYAVECCGSEHILFGTDTYSAGFQRGRIEYAMISDSAKENILRNNALRLFDRVFKS